MWRRIHGAARRGRGKQPWSTALRVRVATRRGWREQPRRADLQVHRAALNVWVRKRYNECTASRARIITWWTVRRAHQPWGRTSWLLDSSGLLVRGRPLRYSFLRQQRAEIGGAGAGGDSALRGDREGHGASAQAVPTGARGWCQLCKTKQRRNSILAFLTLYLPMPPSVGTISHMAHRLLHDKCKMLLTFLQVQTLFWLPRSSTFRHRLDSLASRARRLQRTSANCCRRGYKRSGNQRRYARLSDVVCEGHIRLI